MPRPTKSEYRHPVPKPSRLQQIQADVAATFRDGVHAHPDPESLSAFQKFTHFWALVLRFFGKNRCQVRASALAYTTLMALVPLLAVAISMLGIFQIDNAKKSIDRWISQLVQNVAPTLGLSGQQGANVSQEAVVTEIVKIVSDIPFGTIGITAMIGLIFAAISMMRTIEAAFNDIWGVTRSRSWWNSILLYWGVLTLGPAVLALVTTSSYVKATFEQVEWMQKLPLLGMLNTALLPIITLAIAFGLFYLLMPNTRVDPRSAAVGAAVAATLWWGNSQLGSPLQYPSRHLLQDLWFPGCCASVPPRTLLFLVDPALWIASGLRLPKPWRLPSRPSGRLDPPKRARIRRFAFDDRHWDVLPTGRAPSGCLITGQPIGNPS